MDNYEEKVLAAMDAYNDNISTMHATMITRFDAMDLKLDIIGETLIKIEKHFIKLVEHFIKLGKHLTEDKKQKSQ